MDSSNVIQLDDRLEDSRISKPSHFDPVLGGRGHLAVLCFAAIIFFGCIVSPPSLMDDVDSVQAQIARNMLQTGDWVTPHLDGVPYMEKPPLKYWTIAVSYLIFGIHDWAARVPVALSAVILCWVIARFGAWAFGDAAGLYAGMALASCIGLFLFTRILIADVMLTLTIAAAMYAFSRLIEDARPSGWPYLFWASLGAGVLLKGLIGAVFPLGTALLYLAVTRRLLARETWKRMRVGIGLLIVLAIAAPWHILAMVRNPPLFDFTMHSEPGSYRGFFWFYFINEQVLRFLNRRYPRDYNTVPRVWFWLYHLLWLFPWSVYLPAAARLNYRSGDKASRVRLLALCWAGFVLVFFSLSTSQEYYTMPSYPAFALLIASALASRAGWTRIGDHIVSAVAALGLIAILTILYLVRNMSASGDIATALGSHPEAYTLSLGHMSDLTLPAFAYLRLALAVAAAALAVGVIGAWRAPRTRVMMSFSLMMLIFFHAARLAQVTFDPYLSSRPLAEAFNRAPEGKLIVDDPYYEFSSVFFYSNRMGLLLNGRINNLEYGSYAPNSPNVFIDDDDFRRLWGGADRCYVVTEAPKVSRLEQLVGAPALFRMAESGGKFLFTNK
jgi:4-amino-4-deoxy-L-arabinose transferase-like glycosyltransferase